MTIHRHKYIQTIISLLILTFIGCNSTEKKEQGLTEPKKNETNLIDSSKTVNEINLLEDSQNIDTLEVIVVQCANGYEYAMYNYDFNPVIENELKKYENIKVKPFPFKTLMGVAYQGVFDKKYCPRLLKKLMLTF